MGQLKHCFPVGCVEILTLPVRRQIEPLAFCFAGWWGEHALQAKDLWNVQLLKRRKQLACVDGLHLL